MQSDNNSCGIGGITNSFSTSNGLGGIGNRAIRPTDLPTENRRWIRQHRKLHLVSPHLPSVAHSTQKIVAQSFPTPMEEPKKVLKAQFIGTTEVSQPTGMDTLNEAIDQLSELVPIEQYEHVNVSVAPSMISINAVSN